MHRNFFRNRKGINQLLYDEDVPQAILFIEGIEETISGILSVPNNQENKVHFLEITCLNKIGY